MKPPKIVDRYPSTVSMGAFLAGWGIVVALIALWDPFFWILLTAFVVVSIGASIRRDRTR